MMVQKHLLHQKTLELMKILLFLVKLLDFMIVINIQKNFMRYELNLNY